MAVTINASTTTGLVQSADLSGSLNIQSNGTTVLGVTSTGTSVTGTQSVSGNLSFNSGYGSSAVAYGCRAWVNFNGTGTVAIRASGNVSSITDNGVGNYTVNFTTAMPDANYAAIGSGFRDVFSSAEAAESFTSYAVGSVNALFATGSSGAAFDTNAFSVAIFR
tara:strand:+ start:53 stop:544 length:492 start_codon:yes stop_codon:yes gene_type:complete